MGKEILKIAYSKQHDEYLWLQFKEGDKSALDQIFYENISHLISYGHQFTTKRDFIDDCIQDLFIDLWEKRDRLSSTTSIRFYLLKSLKRRILRGLKKSQKTSIFSELGEVFIEKKMHLSGPDNVKEMEASHELHKAFLSLSTLQREIIYLKYYNNLSSEQIAEILELSKKQVYNALSKAMITLRKVLTTKTLMAFNAILLFDL